MYTYTYMYIYICVYVYIWTPLVLTPFICPRCDVNLRVCNQNGMSKENLSELQENL